MSYRANPEAVAAARNAKAELRRAFPATKFSVSGDWNIRVSWTDDGPEIVQVEEALLTLGQAEAEPAWNGERRLKVDGIYFHFDRYNAAERARREQMFSRRPAPANEVAARRAKSLITKKLRQLFPKNEFTLCARYAGSLSPNLFIEWLNGPQDDEVLAIAQLLSDGVRVTVRRDEALRHLRCKNDCLYAWTYMRGRADRWPTRLSRL